MNRLRTLLGGDTRRDALWLFGGQLVALAVTAVATPIQLERMGAERYGIVVVLSAAVGYVGLLDIGAAWGVMRFPCPGTGPAATTRRHSAWWPRPSCCRSASG